MKPDADKNDDIGIAVTRDGRVYVGTSVPMGKINRFIMRHKYLNKVVFWIGKATNFLIDVLRLPYLFDHMRKRAG